MLGIFLSARWICSCFEHCWLIKVTSPYTKKLYEWYYVITLLVTAKEVKSVPILAMLGLFVINKSHHQNDTISLNDCWEEM
jgi:hypothetical protein